MDVLRDFFHLITSPSALIAGGYIALCLVVFAETGLLVGFFLPGDSLLVTAGLLIATGKADLDIVLLNLLLIPSAIIGDAVGYSIGYKSGPRLLARPDSRFFKKAHLERTQHFYEKHGGKTIVIARFIPVIRTFAPVVAGLVRMPYRNFVVFNVIGAIVWIMATTLGGYWLGKSIPNVDKYLLLVIGAVIFLSILPPAIEFIKHRMRAKKIGELAQKQ